MTGTDTAKIENTVCKALSAALDKHVESCQEGNDLRYVKAPHWAISYGAFVIIIGAVATAIGMYYGDKAFYLEKIEEAKTVMRCTIDSQYDSLRVESARQHQEVMRALQQK